MKYFLIVSICFLPNVLLGAPPSTSCPAGYTPINESAMTLQNDICPSGTSVVAGLVLPPSCLSSSTAGRCFMYAHADTNFSDNTGIYQFSDFCPLSGITGIQKCVKLTSETTKCSNNSQVQFVADWSASCGDLPIKGIGMCSSEYGLNVGSKSDSLTVSSTDENRYCWCKMTSPAVSSWVYLANTYSGVECALSCAYGCGATIVNANSGSPEATFRATVFSSLGE